MRNPLVKFLLHFRDNLELFLPNLPNLGFLPQLGLQLQKVLLDELHKHQQRRIRL